jgi:hypothetical protein
LDTPLRVKTAGGSNGRTEEYNEVTTHLNILRKKHDQSAEFTLRHQRALDTLNFELNHLSRIENSGSGGQDSLQDQLKSTVDRIAEVKGQQVDAQMNTETYEHMLERMKQTKLYLELRGQDLQQSLHCKRQVLKEELMRQRKVREVQCQARVAFSKVKTTLLQDRLDMEDLINSMEEDRKLKEENAAKREERFNRQQELTEKAANEDRDIVDRRIRDSVGLHRMWGRFLMNKLQSEKQKSTAVEEAFQKIRVITGFNEIGEVVERFLTREQTYMQLVNSASQTEQRLASLRAVNANLEEKIAELRVEGDVDEHAREHREVETLAKQNAMRRGKLVKSNTVYERVLRWVIRMVNRLKAAESGAPYNLLSRTASEEVKPSLSTVFWTLKELAAKLLVFVANSVRPRQQQDLRIRLQQMNTDTLKQLAVRMR